MDELIREDSAIANYLDDETDEIQAAMDDVLEDDGSDIDDIAEITDEDVDNFDYDIDAESQYYEDIDTNDVGPDGTIDYELDDEEDDENYDIEDINNALLDDDEY
jgi:hypothetical protein